MMRSKKPDADRTVVRVSTSVQQPTLFPHSSPFVPGFAIGDRIADTYLVKCVIEGGMATVYSTYHERWNLDLIVKAPKAEVLTDPEHAHRITREAEAWTELGLHPHIAYCYYVHPLHGVPLLIIEYLDGGNLRDWITEGQCADLKVGLDLAIQACHGLEHAHSRKLIHRDIKPENILLARDGTLKITDFGIARWRAETAQSASRSDPVNRHTTPGTVGGIGTYDYMPPEQFVDAHAVDARTDIFSLGVCLYEMFCGRRPYGIAVGPRQEAPEPRKLRGDDILPEELCILLQRCVAWDPETRPKSVTAIRHELLKIYKQLFQEESTFAHLPTVSVDADGWNNRGCSYLALGYGEKAVECFRKALEINPLHLEATFNLLMRQIERGDIRDAVARITAVRVAHDAIVRRACLEARIHLTLSNPRLAEQCLLEAEPEGDSYPEYWITLGDIRLALGQLQDAVAAYSKVLPLIPSRTDIIQRLQKANAVAKSWSGKFIPARVHFFTGLRHMMLGESFSQFILLFPLWVLSLPGLWGVVMLWLNGFSLPAASLILGGGLAASLMLFLATSEKIHHSKFWPRLTKYFCKAAVNYAATGHVELSRPHTVKESVQHVHAFNQLFARAKESLNGHDYVAACDQLHTVRQMPGYERHPLILDFAARLARRLPKQTLRGCWVHKVYDHHRTISVLCTVYSSDASIELIGGTDKNIQVWDLMNNRCLKVIQGHTESIFALSLTSDGRYMLSGSLDKTMRFWDLQTGRCLRSFRGHDDALSTVYCSLDRRWALSGSWDGTVRLWNLLTGQCIQHFKAHSGSVRCALLSADNRWAFSVGADGILRQWDLVSGSCAHTLEGHEGDVRGLALSLDGRWALTGGHDKTLRLWDLSRSAVKCILHGHASIVNSVVLTPDGRFGLSGSSDRTAKFWDLQTGDCLATLAGHPDLVRTVVLTDDARFALTVTSDALRVWELDWELQPRHQTDWNEEARPFLDMFIRCHTPYEFESGSKYRQSLEAVATTLSRKGVPRWAEEDFNGLLYTLACTGFGWLSAKGIRQVLENTVGDHAGLSH